MQPLEVRQDRVDKAQAVFAERVKSMLNPEQTVMMILTELCLYHGMSYDEDLHLRFDLTDLQWVAVAAAAAAIAEAGGLTLLTDKASRGTLYVDPLPIA